MAKKPLFGIAPKGTAARELQTPFRGMAPPKKPPFKGMAPMPKKGK